MSISSLFFVVGCLSCYKLGAYNAKNPGAMTEHARAVWKWMNQ